MFTCNTNAKASARYAIHVRAFGPVYQDEREVTLHLLSFAVALALAFTLALVFAFAFLMFTRTCVCVCAKICFTNYCKRSFSYSRAVLWNSLHREIKQSNSLKEFKTKLKNHTSQSELIY